MEIRRETNLIAVGKGPLRITASVALAAPPSGPLLEVTGRVLLAYVPLFSEVTVTFTVQLPEAGIVAPAKATEEPPSVAVTVPPGQVFDTEAGVALTRSAG